MEFKVLVGTAECVMVGEKQKHKFQRPSHRVTQQRDCFMIPELSNLLQLSIAQNHFEWHNSAGTHIHTCNERQYDTLCVFVLLTSC